MTAKEKAHSIVFSYLRYTANVNDSKKYAQVAVDEIMKLLDTTLQGFLDADFVSYWNEVKKQIEKI
jgi:hypothetical protein